MASYAFVKYRDEEVLPTAGDDLETTYLTTILPEKLRRELEYIERQSFVLDLIVMAKVAVSILTPADHRQPKAEGRGEKEKIEAGNLEVFK